MLAVALAGFNLYHEFHAGEISSAYTIVAATVIALWLVAVIAGVAGRRSGIFFAGLIAFIQFGLVLSTHFVSGVGALNTYVKHEGLALAAIDMALIPACLLVIMSAGVCWTNLRGYTRRSAMLPLAIAALLGSVLVILQATDDLHRVDFGRANPEDGAFAAAVLAAIWLTGGLWISRVRRTGALIIALATFGVWYSFVTLHMVVGGTTVTQIAQTSGELWALIAAGAAIVAAASFLVSLGVLALSLLRLSHSAPVASPSTVQRRA